MEFEEGLAFFLVTAFLGILIGMLIGDPTELENGCLVENDKVYCEVKNYD